MGTLKAWSTEDTVLHYTSFAPPHPPPTNYQKKITCYLISCVASPLCIYVVPFKNCTYCIVVIRCTICILQEISEIRIWKSVGWLTSVLYPLSEWPTVSCVTILSRENWIIYQGPGFRTVVGFGSSSIPPLPHLPVSSTGDTQEDRERETICWHERGVGGGEEPNHRKAWKPCPL